MASYSKTDSTHQTLSTTTVDTVTITTRYQYAEVANRSGSTSIYFTIANGSTGTPATPTAAGDNTYVVPAGTTLTVLVPGYGSAQSDGFVVKLIGNANDYSVTGINQ